MSLSVRPSVFLSLCLFVSLSSCLSTLSQLSQLSRLVRTSGIMGSEDIWGFDSVPQWIGLWNPNFMDGFLKPQCHIVLKIQIPISNLITWIPKSQFACHPLDSYRPFLSPQHCTLNYLDSVYKDRNVLARPMYQVNYYLFVKKQSSSCQEACWCLIICCNKQKSITEALAKAVLTDVVQYITL